MKKTLLISVLVCLPVFLLAQTTATFTLGGTQTFVSPAGVTNITVQAWGAGGAGGSSTNPGFNGAYAGSGGGGGAFASAPLTITSGQTLTVNVGIGGKGVTSNNGGAGGSSGITGYSILAEGGKGGLVNNGSLVLGGAAGLAANSTGTTRFSGTAGGNGEFGFTDDTGSIISSGAGGNGANGGGLGGAGIATAFTSSVGNAGTAPGGGGSGGRSSFLAAARRGGDGGDGKVTISYNCPTYSLTSTTASAVNVCSGDASEVTLTGNLPVGLYSVSYQIQGVAQTPVSMNVTTAGTGSFIASGFTTVGTSSIKIIALSSGSSSIASENCSSTLNIGNTTTVIVNSSGTAPVANAGTNATCNQITANWEAVTGAVYYELDVSTVSNFSSFVAGYNALNVGNVLTYNITGLTNSPYYYRVRAYNGNCVSANSNTITYATAVVPGTVTSSAATAAICTEFIARWVALNGATSYLLDVSTTSGFNAGTFVGAYNSLDVGNVTSYDVTGLNANTQYYYRLKAKNGCGMSVNYSAVQNITTSNAVPGNVTSMTANNINCNSFNARWNSASQATSYLLDVSTSSTFASFLPGYQSLDVGGNGYVVTGLNGGTQYYYRLKAKNGCGVSANYSVTRSPMTSSTAPLAPVIATPTSLCNQITVSWSAPVGTLDYTVQMSTANTFPATGATQTVNGLTTTNYVFTGLLSGQTYYFRVYARNGCSSGNGTVSAVVSGITGTPPNAPTISITAGSIPMCQTDRVTLTSSAVPDATYSYLWSTGQTGRSINVSSAGNFTVQFIKSGGCNSPISAPIAVTIEDLPTAIAGGSTTICSNGSAKVTGASASNGTIKWTFSGGSGSLDNDAIIDPTYTPTLGGAARTVILTMTVTSINSCAPQIATATYTVNINAAPIVSITGSKIICSNGSATVGAGEASAANGTVLWTHDGLGTLSNNTTLTPTYTAAAGDAGKQVTLTLTVTASPACATAYTVSDVYPIAVRPENTVTAASSSPTLCVNTLMTDITHTTTGATGIGTPSGLPSGVTAAWASNTITISGTPTNSGTFNYIIPLTGGCGTYNATGTIIVNLNTAGPASSSPTICNHTLMPDITHTTTNATGIGVPTGLPPGITATWSTNTITISGTPTNTGTFNYTIPLIGGCGSVSATGTITVNPLPVTPGIGTIVQPTCINPKGSIELNGLLTGISWIITQSGSVSKTYNTSDPNFTVPDLIPGNYTFTIHDGVNCPSLATVNIEIKAPITNVYNGSWSNGSPVNTDILEFAADFSSTGDLEGCACKVDAGKKVTINTGHTLTIENQVIVDSGNGAALIFENAASLIQINNVVNTGNITYKRNTFPIRQADYVYWSTPVSPQKLKGVSPLTKADKMYSNIGYNWVQESPSTIMIVGKGYIMRGPETFSNTVRSNFTASFIGVPNNGNITGEAVVADKYFLIGNPYPSALDADDFINTNSPVLEGTLYFWTHNTPVVLGGAYQYGSDDYATYNLTGGVGTAAGSGDDAVGNNASEPSGQIGAGQAFFAKIATSGNIVYDNTMRNGGADNGQFFKPSKESKTKGIEKHRIWLNMTNSGGAFKQLLVGYIGGASNEYEKKYDGLSMDSNKYIDFYSVVNDNKLTIQGRALPFTDIDFVPLGYKSTINGDFTIAISKTDENMNMQPIYLEDKLTGTIHNLKESNYTFKTAEGTFTDRFVLRYTNKTLGAGDIENAESNVLISVKDKVVKITSTIETLAKVYIFDVSGKLIYEKLNIGEKELQIVNLQSSNQVLLIKVALENGNLTTSKIIF
ncbi:fibronectin type III domain-containing protein [Flavobacterium sp. LC2016-01]|uniref:fibronectin type III domain-containing protein n=1 Tax=Flavobacterium sp. LC2016-01 TaxID=2675876 RepID=UPI0018ACE8C1|nr:fibronectin type III domain-containing protein [Flavobacterium sp. LC2016-01]